MKNSSISSHNKHGQDEVETLKAEFLSALAQVEGGLNSLRAAVVALLDEGVDRHEMLAWSVEAGYSESYTRTLLSQVLISAGQRARKAGAGPRTSEDALTLAQTAIEMYGDNAAKVLLASYRALKAGKVPTTPKRRPRHSGNHVGNGRT